MEKWIECWSLKNLLTHSHNLQLFRLYFDSRRAASQLYWNSIAGRILQHNSWCYQLCSKSCIWRRPHPWCWYQWLHCWKWVCSVEGNEEGDHSLQWRHKRRHHVHTCFQQSHHKLNALTQLADTHRQHSTLYITLAISAAMRSEHLIHERTINNMKDISKVNWRNLK